MRNTVRPGTESTEIHPSWSEMILLTSAKPSPVPFSRPETNGSNTSHAISGGKPGPSSERSQTMTSATSTSALGPEPTRSARLASAP